MEDDYFNNYLIMEDDAELDVSLESLYNTLLNMPEKFDVLHISKSDWYPFEKEKKVNDIFYRPQKKFFNRATGYIISKQGCVKLLDAIQGNMINVPADDLLSNTYINTNNLDLYYSERFVFRERDDAVSITDEINKMVIV
jgi:GR25 family glycosyltransferase involved in LPS biosynthesis